MTDRRLTRDLNLLIRDGLRGNGELDAPETRPAIPSGSGTGRTEERQGDSAAGIVYRERIVIYSKVLVQEDGAYELPDNWPSSPPSYSGQNFGEDDLPDPDAPYLIHRRVHAYVYTQDGPYLEICPVHHLLTHYEEPFDTSRRIVWPAQGEPSYSWRPTTYAAAWNDAPSWDTPNPHHQRLSELLSQLTTEYNAT
jgi:hypothetical protein